MKNQVKWITVVACALFGMAAVLPSATMAQSKAKPKAKVTAQKKAVSKKKAVKAKTTVAKAKPPKSGVITAGSFRPLRNTDRIKVLLPRRPTTKSNMTVATSRRTVFTNRTITPSPQTYTGMSATNYGTTALIINSPNSRWWWGQNGPPSTSYYDPHYGWITVVQYSWGNVMYTYGYQVVNYWNGEGYSWVAYDGVTGVAYPVLYR